MTEIHTYRCDICGQTFDFKDDCREHEIEHNVAKLKGEVVMMDSRGEILSLDDIHNAIEQSFAIYVKCKDAADILWKMFEEDSYFSPISDINTPIQYPAFFTYDDHWRYMRDFEEEYNRLLDLKITAKNALLQ